MSVCVCVMRVGVWPVILQHNKCVWLLFADGHRCSCLPLREMMVMLMMEKV